MSERERATPADGQHGSFKEAFEARLDSIFQRGKACGMTITDICKGSGVARATPDRWKAKTPLTIDLVDKMEAVVVDAEARRKAGK